MKGKTILIVDDEEGIVFLLEELLASAGYKTISATTGPEALERIEEEKIDLLILDFQLPLMNGLEVLQKTSQKGIKTPAIMISGMTERIEIELKEKNRIVGVLQKPFDIKEVLELIEEKLNPYEMSK